MLSSIFIQQLSLFALPVAYCGLVKRWADIGGYRMLVGHPLQSLYGAVVSRGHILSDAPVRSPRALIFSYPSALNPVR